jgi:predicted transcriptional regulator
MDSNIKKIKKIHDDLSSKNLVQCDDDSIKYAMKPLGKAIVENKTPKQQTKKAKWDDKIICPRCGKTFIRSNRTAHNKTVYHKIYDEVGEKFQKIIIDNKDI